MTVTEALKTLPQYILPQHGLSRLMSRLTHSQYKPLKNLLIQQIIKHYRVNMDEALLADIDAYKSFNDFFTRELKPGIRTVASGDDAIACPADGVVSQAGWVADGQIFQAKGKHFSTLSLLGGDQTRADVFADGSYATIYLSPKDYHRLHMPITGTLTGMAHIPGRLFSVNTSTTNAVPNLFARNERVCCYFDTAAGPMALILVGAIFVSSIETVWHGVVTPPTAPNIRTWEYQDNAPTLSRGEEMGRFNMGSTIIVLFAKNKMGWAEAMKAGAAVKLGEKIGKLML